MRRIAPVIVSLVVLGIVLGAGAAPRPASGAAAPLQRLVPPPPGGLYLGAHSLGLETREGRVAAWGRIHGRTIGIAQWYQHWLSGQTRFRPDWAARVARQGAVPLITWEPWRSVAGQRRNAHQPAISLARIASGRYDRYIRSWATAVAAYRRPVMIRLMHEMNGTWYPWGIRVNGNTPALYRAAWRRVHRIFDRAGARNVSWVWSVNNLTGADDTADLAAAYPGDRWVDWVATSGFNWGDAYTWSDWREADALFRPTFDFLSRYRKPVMISEIGTTRIGGSARRWIPRTLARLRTDYPRLRAVIWYDAIDGARLDFRLRGDTLRALASARALDGWIRTPRVVGAGRR